MLISTQSGGKLDLLDPDPDDIRIADIVVHLSRLNRFCGATTKPWSVASHSLLCEALLPATASYRTRLAVIMHDFHEYAIGDIITPVAHSLGYIAEHAIHILKQRVQFAICCALGFAPTPTEGEAIKEMDRLALATEHFRLQVPSEAWRGYNGPDANMDIVLDDFNASPAYCGAMLHARVAHLVANLNLKPRASLGL